MKYGDVEQRTEHKTITPKQENDLHLRTSSHGHLVTVMIVAMIKMMTKATTTITKRFELL